MVWTLPVITLLIYSYTCKIFALSLTFCYLSTAHHWGIERNGCTGSFSCFVVMEVYKHSCAVNTKQITEQTSSKTVREGGKVESIIQSRTKKKEGKLHSNHTFWVSHYLSPCWWRGLAEALRHSQILVTEAVVWASEWEEDFSAFWEKILKQNGLGGLTDCKVINMPLFTCCFVWMLSTWTLHVKHLIDNYYFPLFFPNYLYGEPFIFPQFN